MPLPNECGVHAGRISGVKHGQLALLCKRGTVARGKQDSAPLRARDGI